MLCVGRSTTNNQDEDKDQHKDKDITMPINQLMKYVAWHDGIDMPSKTPRILVHLERNCPQYCEIIVEATQVLLLFHTDPSGTLSMPE